MKTNRRIAILVGLLYIIGTLTGSLTVTLSEAIISAPDFLEQTLANQNQVIAGGLLFITMGLALALIPVALYPLLKAYNHRLAIGYVVFRGALETFLATGYGLSLLTLVSLSREYALAGAGQTAGFESLGQLLYAAGAWIGEIQAIVFPLGALMFYSILYQSRLIPRWLTVWGLIAVVLHLFGGGLLAMFGLIEPMTPLSLALAMPIAVQEIVMALWLIFKGFNPQVMTSEQVRSAGLQLALAHE